MWDFQRSLIPTGESIAASLGTDPSGVMKILAWMIRATFLDPRVARQAALDEGGNMAAIGAIAISMLPSWLYILALGSPVLLYGGFRYAALIASVIVGIIGLAAAIFILAALSQPMLNVKLSAGQLLRALAYAQGAGVLGFIPILGVLIGLWKIPASVAAVREISGAETSKAVIYMIAGALIVAVAMMVLSPILLVMFARL